MQVNHKIIILFFQGSSNFRNIFFNGIHFVNVWVAFKQAAELFLCNEVDACSGQLLLQAAQHGGSKHNISDGTEAYDQDLHSGKVTEMR